MPVNDSENDGTCQGLVVKENQNSDDQKIEDSISVKGKTEAEDSEKHANDTQNHSNNKQDVSNDVQKEPISETEAVQQDKPSPNNDALEGMTVIDEIADDSQAQNTSDSLKQHSNIEPDTEMVSEDELPSEVNKEPETEAVSDEELPATTDLPDTEAVSDDELPPEGSEKKKKKSTKSTPLKSDKKDVSEVKAVEIDQTKKGVKRKLDNEDGDSNSKLSDDSIQASAVKKPSTECNASKKSKTLPELEKYWKAVREDASDFTGWTYLLQYVDQENDVEAAREAYDSFLSNYPYCYGYWRKYADYEKRKGNQAKCEEVFERGLKAIPFSVDLWIHYLNHCKTTMTDEEQLRSTFERSIEQCGLEFRSDRLWDSYLKWEAENKNVYNITKIYDKLLIVPTQGYQTHFEKFCEHVNSNPLNKVLSVDEFLALRQEVMQELRESVTPVVAETDGTDGPTASDDADAPPGEEPADKDDTVVSPAEETAKLREKIISTRKKLHLATKSLVEERQVFEDGIKRPYFHVKALERCQLKNWKEYLTFEISKGDKKRIIVLFERCLIACALYEEMWVRYVRYLEENAAENVDMIRDVYERACTIHHRKKPNIHLHWSVYEETQGNFKKSEEILDHLEKLVPNLVQVIYRRINLSRRSGDMKKVCELYEQYIDKSKSKLMANNMTIKYARFSWKILNDVDKAVSILKEAVEKDKENPRFYLQLIDMALQRHPVDEKEVIAIIDSYLATDSVELEQRVMFAQRKIEFLEDFGSSITTIQKATEDFKKVLKQLQDTKKRNTDFKPKDEPSTKKSKPESKEVPHTGPTQMSQQPPPQGQYSAPHYNQSGGYNQPPPQGYQGGYNQPPYNQPYNQPPYNQNDPNYNSYQNWGYNNQNYGNYNNQGWGGYNNYY